MLVAIPAFSSASSIYFVSANSPTRQIRFGSKSYCGFNITQTEGIQRHESLGCIGAGYSYTLDSNAMGMYLPSAITVSLGKAAAMLLVCEYSLAPTCRTLALTPMISCDSLQLFDSRDSSTRLDYTILAPRRNE